VDPKHFSSSTRGRVVRTAGGYWAFIPEPLPRQVDLTSDLLGLLEQATGALHRLGGIGSLLPNPDLLIVPYVRLEAVLSSRIEGTRSSVSDLLLFEAGQLPPWDRGGDDVREVGNHVAALDHGINRLREGFPLSVRLLCEVHAILMHGVRGEHATPGELRRSQNWIGGTNPDDALFVPPPVDEMRYALDDLERFLHERTLPLVVQLALAHAQFEMIHPFLDGNGRLGRLLVTLMLIDRDVLPQPLLYLSVAIERERARYYDLLSEVGRTGSFDGWLRFFLTAVAVQARDAEARTMRLVHGQAALRDDLLAARAPTTAVRLGELLFVRPYLSIANVCRELGVTAPTAAKAIALLEARGHVEEVTGRARGRIWGAPRVFDAIYGDVAP